MEKRLPHFGSAPAAQWAIRAPGGAASGALDVHLAYRSADQPLHVLADAYGAHLGSARYLLLSLPLSGILFRITCAFVEPSVGSQLVILMWFQTIEEQYRAIFYVQRPTSAPR